MKTRYVLPVDHQPIRAPGLTSIVAYMAMDLYPSMPGWVWGVVWSILAVLWFGWAIIFWAQTAKPLPGYGDQSK